MALGCGLIAPLAGVAQEKGNWRAANSAARSMTGDVALSNEKLAINFASFWIAQIRALKPEELAAVFNTGDDAAGSGNATAGNSAADSGAAGNSATASGAAASATAGRGDLYRIKIPGDKRFLHKNTLCGGEDVQWVAAYATRRELHLAFFSGSRPPVFTPDAMAKAQDVCGTFAYVK